MLSPSVSTHAAEWSRLVEQNDRLLHTLRKRCAVPTLTGQAGILA